MEMLRERIKGLEFKIIEMIRNGQENVAIADKLHRWTRALTLTDNPGDLPQVAVTELQREFLIPQAGIRIWGAAEVFSRLPFAQPVGQDVKSFASSLSLPYCGINSGFEAAQWFDEPAVVMSLAMIPLRHGAAQQAFGMLVLGSPDPTRYTADMGTEFLDRIGELCGAALSRLLPAG